MSLIINCVQSIFMVTTGG